MSRTIRSNTASSRAPSPKGEYGGGTVMIWDRGTWEPVGDPDDGLAKGDLKFRLHGERLKGGWVLVRMKPRRRGKRENWLLIKHRDEFAGDGNEPTEEIRDQREERPDHGPDRARRQRRVELQGQGSKKNSEAETKDKSFRWHGKKSPKSRRAVAPEFVEPELATLDTHVPTGPGWLHEIKYDGYRILGRKAGDETTLFSRSGLDWTVRFRLSRQRWKPCLARTR